MTSDSYLANLRRIRREAWLILASTIGQGFAGFGISEAVGSLYLVRMGYGPEFVGTSAAASNLGYALASLPSAALSQRLGARRAMMLGSIGWALGTLLMALSDLLPPWWGAPWSVAMRVLASCGTALFQVSSQPYLTAVTSAEERPHVFALTISLRPLGSVLGGLVGGLLPAAFAGFGGAHGGFGPLLGVSLADPRAYGMTLAAGALIFTPVLLVLRALPRTGASIERSLEAGARQEADAPGAWTTDCSVSESAGTGLPGKRQQAAWRRLAERSAPAPVGVLAAIALVCALRVGGEFSARTFFSVYLDARWAVPTASIGTALALASFLSIPAPLITPALVARWGRVPTIVAGALAVAASIALVGASGSWPAAAAAFVALTVAAAMARSVWSLVVQESVTEPWRPMAAGISNLASGLGTVLMASVGGVLAAGLGYPVTFLASAAMVALGALTVRLAFRSP